MTNLEQHSISTLLSSLPKTAFALAVVCFLTIVEPRLVQAQTFTVIHTFTGVPDGAHPQAGLRIDESGNLYGTAEGGGVGYGTVFKLVPRNSHWVFTPLYQFAGGYDGSYPAARVTIGADGNLYGSTGGGGQGGSCDGCGTVFSLQPPPNPCLSALCPWRKTTIYRFLGPPNDGESPQGDLALDPAGSLYGTTFSGGSDGWGTVYRLTKSNGNWSEGILHSFTGDGGGAEPSSGLILDSAGNIYGTDLTESGNSGQIFELTPSGSGWAFHDLYDFQGGSDGGFSEGGLIFDRSGNLYGATSTAGSGGGGTAYELVHSNGGWNFTMLYSFVGSPRSGPVASLLMDSAGNLYGTTLFGGIYGYGSVFKLTPHSGGYAYTSLHDFTGERDGSSPYSSLIFDASGNLYGTTAYGGSGVACSGGCGVVFEITP